MHSTKPNPTQNQCRAKLGLPPAGIGKVKKAVTIPNAWPFKEQLLEELAQAKRRMEEEQVRKKEEAALRRKQALLGTDVAALVKQAEARGQAFDQQRQQEHQDAAAAAASGTGAGASKCVKI
jgi:predicted nucleotidyltransferase